MNQLLIKIVVAAVLACTANAIEYHYEKVVAAGSKFCSSAKFVVPVDYTGTIKIDIDTDKHTPWPKSNENVMPIVCALNGNILYRGDKRSDNIVSYTFTNLYPNTYRVGFQCMNSDQDCDVEFSSRGSLARDPTASPTMKPTYSPTPRRPIDTEAFPELGCVNSSRYVQDLSKEYESFCECREEDGVCHYCCDECKDGNCIRTGYNDLQSLPLYYSKWELKTEGSVANGSPISYTMSVGTTNTVGTEFTVEESSGVESTIGQTTGHEAGGSLGFEFPPFSATASYSWYTENSWSITTISSTSIGRAVSSFLTKEMTEESSQGCTTNAGHLRAKIYQLVLNRWDGQVTINTRTTHCVYDSPLPPLCPYFDACLGENCDSCITGTFADPQVDAFMSRRLEPGNSGDVNGKECTGDGCEKIAVPISTILGIMAFAAFLMFGGLIVYKKMTQKQEVQTDTALQPQVKA